MVNSDGVDFSELRSKEMMFLLMLSECAYIISKIVFAINTVNT